jgi:hypothetical protein
LEIEEQSDLGFDFVDVLAPWARAARELETEIILVDHKVVVDTEHVGIIAEIQKRSNVRTFNVKRWNVGNLEKEKRRKGEKGAVKPPLFSFSPLLLCVELGGGIPHS